jgi:predicted neuraminidase
MHPRFRHLFFVIIAGFVLTGRAAGPVLQTVVPKQWDPAVAGDRVMQRLVRVTPAHAKGAHDAEFVCVGDRAYIVEHDNDVAPGHGAGAAMYCVLSVVNLQSLRVEKTHVLAKAGEAFANETLPAAQVFVPRIIRKDEHTLRTYFCSQPTQEQAVTWYRDFDLRTQRFEPAIHRAKLKTAAGVFDMEPRHFHADAAANGFKRSAVNQGLYIFDSFKEFDGRRYVALNNFPGKQNALAMLQDDFATFEVLGHYNEPQTQPLSESSVNRLPDGTWMAICRNDAGNYHFTTSLDGKKWTEGVEKSFVPNGLNSKPTFDQFGGVYYLGWQENTRFGDCGRSVFNVDVSKDGKTWQRKYRFETPHSFQYPTFHEHEGTIWLSVTQSDHRGSTDRIMFGKLESVGAFESQAGLKRIEWPAPPPAGPAVLKPGVKLFTDREYVVDEVPAVVRELPFHRTSIERLDVIVSHRGTLYALTPTERPKAASQEAALKRAGFERVEVPEAQLFSGEINRVSLYRKAVKTGERFQFSKMVLLVLAEGVAIRDEDGLHPSVLLNPGAPFQDDARPGGMIIGMDRTPKGRIWGCWTGTGDRADGYFLLATSDDGGASWSRPRVAVGARSSAGQKVAGALVGNLWTDPKGRLWLFFDQQLGDPQKRITNWYMRCDQPDANEPEWTEPVMFAEGCTLNKPTVLKNGDWLLPVSDWHQKTARVFVSTDEGKQWKERGNVRFPDWEFDEHMTVELRDGRLWMLARTKGQPYESFSSDGGVTWSEPAVARTVQNVNARFFLRRLQSGRILLVKNGSPAERLKVRSHMSAWLSDDEGATWKGGLILDERAGVSYPDGFESPDGLIHVLYDWNRHTDAEILMARFRESDVLAGKAASPDAALRLLANKATGSKPELLYNGIQLPSPWPPPFRDSRSGEPMEVPYLKGRDERVGPQLAGFRPKVIPIDVGRQLFVDDFLVEQTTLKRTFHKARKFEGNPVFKPETPAELAPSVEGERGEEATVFTGQGGIFYDPAEKLFKLFHVAGWRGALSVATSPDMVHWSRPDLGKGKGNQLLPSGLEWQGARLTTGGSDNCVWLDLNASNPAERLKYLTCWMHVPKAQRPNGFNHSLHVSDGTMWSDAVTTTLAADDYCSFFFNPFRKKWCFSIKRGTVRGRSRYYYESDEFLKGAAWDRSVFWTASDRLDLPEPSGGYPGASDAPQLYSLNAVAYESLMVGMHYIHRGPKNEVCDAGKFPKLVDLELGFSRDGFHWDRPDRTGFISGSRTEGSWDRGYLHGAAGVFVVKGDELIFPYMGTSGVAPSGTHGMYTGGSIGLATLRRDGFASMDGPGELLTRPLRFSGTHCFVNLRGSLQVEMLDSAGKVIEVSKVVSGDATRLRVPLEQLGSVAGKPVQFRFKLLEGSLFSFWVTRDREGASFGYVGAGGPGFAGTKDEGAGAAR